MRTIEAEITEKENDGNKENMIAFEYYSNPDSSPRPLKSLDSSSTWEAIENAEKLVYEARETIINSSYDAPWQDLMSNESSSSFDLDESESHIRHIVSSKMRPSSRRFLKKQKLFNEKNEVCTEENAEEVKKKITTKIEEQRKVYQSPVTDVEICQKCSEEKIENKLEEKYKFISFNKIDSNVKTDTSTKSSVEHINNSNKANMKIQLSVQNTGRLDLMPISRNISSRKNTAMVKTFIFNHSSSTPEEINESLIDVAIQTSFRESSREENVPLNQEIAKSELADCYNEINLKKMESDRIQKDINNKIVKEIKEKSKKNDIAINDNQNFNINDDTNNTDNIKDNDNDISANEESKGSFIQFLCQINKNPEKVDPANTSKTEDIAKQSDISVDKSWDDEFYDEFDTEIDLVIPNLVIVDKIFCGLDKNIGRIIKDADKLEDLFSEAKSYENDKTDKEIKKKIKNDQVLHKMPIRKDFTRPKKINFRQNDDENTDKSENETSDHVRFILKPRSRVSSYESVSSEVFIQQARFSTPLNNYRETEMSNIDRNSKICGDNEKISIPMYECKVDVNVDSKNERSDVNDVNLFVARNKFSSTSSEEKNMREIERKIMLDGKAKNCALKSTSMSVQKLDKKSHLTIVSESSTKKKLDCKTDEIDDKDTKEFKLSISSENIHSLKLSADTNEKTREVIEKNNREQSEKSLIAKRMNRNDLLNDDTKLINNKEHQEHPDNQETDKININKLEQKDYLTPISSKDDIRDRTSFEISGIYSESFEELISELKSTSKECSVNKHEIQSGKKIGVTANEEKISIIHNEKREIELSDKINSVAELEKNERITAASTQINTIDISNKSIHSANKNDKCVVLNGNDKNERSSSPAISKFHQRKSPIASSPSSEDKTDHKKGITNSTEYSEGEIRVPSSCSYSLGEIRIKTNAEKLIGKRELPSNHINNSNSPVQSYGEVLETDIESTLSFESCGQVT